MLFKALSTLSIVAAMALASSDVFPLESRGLHHNAVYGCTKTSECSSFDVPKHSKAACNKGACEFRCDDDYKQFGNVCILKKPECAKPDDCDDLLPKHADRTCTLGTCGFACKTGYVQQGDRTCVKPVVAHECNKNNANKKCLTHTIPAHARHVCPKNVCEYRCNKPYVNDGDKCVNSNTNVNNCGRRGHVCPPAYHGIGTPKCVAGRCTVKCPIGLHLVHRHDIHVCVKIIIKPKL